ncbi:MAG: response regulator [Erythrobacter sp.]|uniref:response regulator n=1 Tax=Erythrobacter sp. TaxID=1042 RepID=UPI0026072C54|nr:response regulator [Erythrobacter sp.]MDJ0978024.1 response regulator [Erythrobacter sp.]
MTFVSAQDTSTGPLQQPALPALVGLLLGLALSVAAVFAVTANLTLTLVFGLGVLALLAGVYFVEGLRAAPLEVETIAPDWSVTVAALEDEGAIDAVAVAITDRANRLVCANPAFSDRFGIANAPPQLALDRAGLEAMTKIAREAWRDGSAELETLPGLPDGGRACSVRVTRAGRAGDHLIWRFTPEAVDASASLDALELAGSFGKMLSRGGIESVITNPDGTIRSASAGFAARAVGDPDATLAGHDFVSLLRSDDRDRLFFTREGRQGTAQTLIDIPLEPSQPGESARAEETTSLMLLIDSGLGIGSGWDSSSQAGVSQLGALLAQLPLGLAMTDRDGRFLFGNGAFLRAVDREGRGLPTFPTDLVVTEDKTPLSDAVRRHGRGPATSGDMAVRLTNQPNEPVSMGLAGVRGLGEAAVLISLADSSEENQLKRQVAQATKMQAVGQLAGGVAHDFNNVLTAIIGTCDLMLLRHTPGDSDYDDIQQIQANSNRAAALTRQLLAFSRQQTLRPEVLQLPDVVSEVNPLITRLLGEKISFYVQHDRNLGPVRADPQQLEQVIMNLAVNARDAINAKAAQNGSAAGRISLLTRSVEAKQVRQLGSEVLPADDYTVLIVQDTGGGIPPHVLPKLFEPFFTTKEQGKGTGLGLSTAYGIVKQSGGFIFADNVTNSAGDPTGARFTVYFPVHRGEAPRRKEAPAPVSSDWSGGGNILLVEDEDMVRAVAERALTRAGYKVTACEGGEEGLSALKEGGDFDLVVSDVVMPGMDGPAMVRAIRERHPEMPILFMSGYAEEQLRKEIDIPDMHFIAKPFSVSAIGDKVSSVMRAATQGEATFTG